MVERIKKPVLIYNPTSGQEIIKKEYCGNLDMRRGAMKPALIKRLPEPFSAQNEAERAAKAGFDLIIAAGGDNFDAEVVNGVAGLENRPQVALSRPVPQ